MTHKQIVKIIETKKERMEKMLQHTTNSYISAKINGDKKRAKEENEYRDMYANRIVVLDQLLEEINNWGVE